MRILHEWFSRKLASGTVRAVYMALSCMYRVHHLDIPVPDLILKGFLQVERKLLEKSWKCSLVYYW